jgi:hypothetical protein
MGAVMATLPLLTAFIKNLANFLSRISGIFLHQLNIDYINKNLRGHPGPKFFPKFATEFKIKAN